MLQYILECIAFQLLFLIIYDLFLKGETFFQWNRVYLLGTYLLSVVLPLVKIEAFRKQVPQAFTGYQEFWWRLQDEEINVRPLKTSFIQLSWQEWVLYSGMLLATILFCAKLLQLYRLKKQGKHIKYTDFTQIIITDSAMAFSFFRSIFLGDKVVAKNHESIIAHELVHIKQGHTYDLLFFELMRIVSWFNPLVYIFQKRTSELHEFIADAHVAKERKSEHYQQLLSQVFQTEHISFINQFFTKSLIKKRIVMLQKSKSKKVWQLKYLLLIPMVIGMLFYTSCEFEEQESSTISNQNFSVSDEALIKELIVEIEDVKKVFGQEWNTEMFKRYAVMYSQNTIESKKEYFAKSLTMAFYLKELIEKYPDKIKVDLKTLSYPTSLDYENFVKREKAFQILDENLRISVSEKDMNIKLILKDDKNLGTGDWITVANVKDLTGAEVKSVNAALEMMKGTPRNVVIKDEHYSFLITNDIRRPIEIGMFEESDNSITSKKEEVKTVSFASIDQVPIFPGCENADNKRTCFNDQIQKHIGKNFNYPSKAQEAGIQGRVSVMFTISSKGTIENIIMRGSDKLLEDEVERIIKKLPQMTPGKNKGKAVNVPFSIPVNFKLQ